MMIIATKAAAPMPTGERLGQKPPAPSSADEGRAARLVGSREGAAGCGVTVGAGEGAGEGLHVVGTAWRGSMQQGVPKSFPEKAKFPTQPGASFRAATSGGNSSQKTLFETSNASVRAVRAPSSDGRGPERAGRRGGDRGHVRGASAIL